MAGIDLATAEAKLTLWLKAEDAVASGQAYQIGNRMMRRADLSEIRDAITYWDAQVQQLSASSDGQRGIRMRGAVPID
jgi:hypothetical protein